MTDYLIMVMIIQYINGHDYDRLSDNGYDYSVHKWTRLSDNAWWLFFYIIFHHSCRSRRYY